MNSRSTLILRPRKIFPLRFNASFASEWEPKVTVAVNAASGIHELGHRDALGAFLALLFAKKVKELAFLATRGDIGNSHRCQILVRHCQRTPKSSELKRWNPPEWNNAWTPYILMVGRPILRSAHINRSDVKLTLLVDHRYLPMLLSNIPLSRRPLCT